eukprot:gnl/Chilomastix_cuspidata/582.p1 GENE.gnl/Chilomastix_cuspidata/582~~gnl/Chilomastix_cuspidata/582.p1  ORF type:complete len:563 (+),score=222.50 gnl/Chilomastix_cuspidata/582:339-2027(+)
MSPVAPNSPLVPSDARSSPVRFDPAARARTAAGAARRPAFKIDPQELIVIQTSRLRWLHFLQMILASLLLLLAAAAADDSFYTRNVYDSGELAIMNIQYVVNVSMEIVPETTAYDSIMTFEMLYFSTDETEAAVYVQTEPCNSFFQPSHFLDADIVFYGREPTEAYYPADTWSIFVPQGECVFFAYIASNSYTNDGLELVSKTNVLDPSDALTSFEIVRDAVGTVAGSADAEHVLSEALLLFDARGTAHFRTESFSVGNSADVVGVAVGACEVPTDAVSFVLRGADAWDVNYPNPAFSVSVGVREPCVQLLAQLTHSPRSSEYELAYAFEPIPASTAHTLHEAPAANIALTSSVPGKIQSHIIAFDVPGTIQLVVSSTDENSGVLYAYPSMCDPQTTAYGIPFYPHAGGAALLDRPQRFNLTDTPCVLLRHFTGGSAPVGGFTVSYSFVAAPTFWEYSWPLFVVCAAGLLLVAVVVLAACLCAQSNRKYRRIRREREAAEQLAAGSDAPSDAPGGDAPSSSLLPSLQSQEAKFPSLSELNASTLATGNPYQALSSAPSAPAE